MFDRLAERGYQVAFASHARAILSVDFPDAVGELEQTILSSSIPIEEIIAGGGGEAKGTQRLRRALHEKSWLKTKFIVEKRINGVPRESQSHEVDHVREFPAGRIALEIEWNNKDPFFDRDLENFKRLHADGAVSVGVIVTRGAALQDNLRALVSRFLDERQITSFEDMRRWGYQPTATQIRAINELQQANSRRAALTFREALAQKFVADKFGASTTHWSKLDERMQRGVGNPCPLVLIGLPDTIVTFNEGLAALAEVQAADDAVDEAEQAEAE